MPSCAFKSCKNCTKNKNKAEGITFHKFPMNVITRDEWAATVRLSRNEPQWQPTTSSVVCSDHFDKRDIYDTKLGLRRIRRTGYPKKLTASAVSTSASPDLAASTSATPDLGASTSASPDLSVCRVCLALDVKMFDMEDFNLSEMFENVTGVSVRNEKESRLHRVCWECAARLTAAAAFRNKAQLSNALLKDMVLNKSDIVKLKHIYQNTLKSPLTIQTVFTSSDIGCGDTSLDYKEVDSLTDKTEFKEEELLNLPMKTNIGSDPLAANDSNIQINSMKSEIFSARSDTTENNEVYYNNNDKILSVNAVMTYAPINDYSYIVLVIDDEENRPKLDVNSNTVNESLSVEDTQTLEVTTSNKAKEMMIGKVGASCEQGNRLNDEEEQQFIALKKNGVSLMEVSEETEKSELSSSTCNIVIKDENEIFVTNDITDKNHDGFNGPGVNDPGFDNDVIADTDVLNDRDGLSEEEYVLSDKENYSSEDSLPAEKYKAKNTRKTKDKTVKTVKRVKKVKDPMEPKNDRRTKPLPDNDVNETLFTFTKLTFEEQIADIVKRQESSNYKNSFFKCTVCFKGFSDEGAYNSHMLRHTDQCGEHKCEVCKTYFKNSCALRKHITAHHAQRFSCTQCTYVATHRQSARLHARWHKGTKYKCPHCQNEFNKFTSYMGHLRIKHLSDFACEICGYSFVSAKGRELHKKLKHRLENVQIPDDGPLCELCNVRFVSSDAHKRHLSVSAKHNTGKRESNDPTKGRKSKEAKELEQRMRDKDADINERRRIYPSQIKKAEKPIPCEQCGIQLQGSRAYHTHFKRMHPDKNRTNYPAMRYPCMCEVCGKMFQSYNHFKDHTAVHTGEQRYKCESCSKSFRTKHRLVVHQYVHSQVRRSYACKLCEKKFSSTSNRLKHMLIHTGVRPYKCEMCGKGFKMPNEKRSHISYVHLKKPWPKRKREKRRDRVQLAPQDQDMDMQAPLRPQDGRNGAYA